MRMQALGLVIMVAALGAIASPPAQAEPNFRLDTVSTLAEIPPLGHADRYLPENEVTRLELRLGERRVYVLRGDEVIASYPVAIGKSSTPTPTGTFEVFQRIENPVWQNPWTGQVMPPGPNSALGLRWIGFAEMSNGIIGFHGTPTVNSIGQAASNGCVRMFNHDVVAMFEQVEIGTTVTVIP